MPDCYDNPFALLLLLFSSFFLLLFFSLLGFAFVGYFAGGLHTNRQPTGISKQGQGSL